MSCLLLLTISNSSIWFLFVCCFFFLFSCLFLFVCLFFLLLIFLLCFFLGGGYISTYK